MASQTLEGHYGRAVALDWCAGCGAFWFDTNESIALAPGSVLRLFTLIGEKKPETRPPLPDTLACPRCHARLSRTTDAQRGTRFQYLRCPGEHGRFITFGEFLREKNFVRPLSPPELAELRQRVQMIQCSSCGAPVDLAAGSVCGHCRAPVSMLDPHQVETAVRELKAAEERRTTEDPTLAARLLMDKLEMHRLFRDREEGWLGSGRHFGLVEAGIGAVVGMLLSGDWK
jgi:transcription elongation factor Elf1